MARPASFLAIHSLQQLATDEQLHYHEACGIILTDFYVDDLLTGASELTHLKRRQTYLIRGVFICGNGQPKHITPEDRETHLPLDSELTQEVKTLGLQWYRGHDVVTVKVYLPGNTKSTERLILPEVARLYNPRGSLKPCIIISKITIQQLTQNRLE